MMDYTGQVFINDKDAWLTWGVFMVGESLDNLLLPAPPKAYTENNFGSQNGKQVFISKTKIDERDVQLEFCIQAITKNEYLIAYKAFVAELRNGLITMKIPFLDEEYQLTVSSFLSLGYYGKFGKLSVRFNEPLSVPVVVEALTGTDSTDFLLTDNDEIILIQ